MEAKEEKMSDQNFPNSHRYLFLMVERFCKWQVSVLSTEFFIFPCGLIINRDMCF